MANFQDLYLFIDRAEKSRKYPAETARGLRTALNTYGSELTDEEKSSLDLFKSNFEQITRSVYTKNATRFSSSSLATYKSRLLKILDNYEEYGIDPTKMNNWNPTTSQNRKGTGNAKKTTQNAPSPQVKDANEEQTPVNMHRIELALRTDSKFVLVVPRDVTAAECEVIKGVLDSLVIKNG